MAFLNNRRLIVLICSVLFSSAVFAQRLNVKTYSQPDGLPDQVIYDGAQDESGKLWFASERGLILYDAYEWSLYPESNNDQLPRVSYIKLDMDEKGILWALPFTTRDNVVRYRDKRWSTVHIAGHPEIPEVNFYDISVLYNKDTATIFTATKEGLAVTKSGSTSWFFENDGLPSNNINSLTRWQNNVVISTSRGAALFSDGKLDKNFFSCLDSVNVYKIIPYFDDEHLFIVFSENGIGLVSSNKYEPINNKLPGGGLPDYSFVFLEKDRSGRIYFGYQGNIFWMDISAGKIYDLEKNNKIGLKGATSAFIDREENLWITSLRGLIKIRKSPFINYTSEDGLTENEVTSISTLGKSSLFLGHNNGYSIISPDQISNYKFEVNMQNHFRNRVLDTDTDSKGNVWIAASERGIGKLTPEGNLTWRFSNSGEKFTAVYITKEDEVIAGTNNSVYKIKDGKLVPFLSSQPYTYIRKIFRLKDGAYILTTPNFGALMVKDGHLSEVYSRDDYLANNAYSVYEYKDTVLVGTMAGLYYIGQGFLHKYIFNGKSISDPVYFITGEENDIWLGTNKGIIKLDGADRIIKRYSVNEGFAGYETNRDAYLIDGDHHLWVGTESGLSCYFKEHDADIKVKPQVEILRLEDPSGFSHAFQKSFKLENHISNFRIHFRALTFYNEKATVYKVKLKAKDSDWQEEFETTENTARFTNIEPGAYNFYVTARNARGIWSEVEASPAFIIDNPFYKKTSFFVFVIGTFAIFFFFVQRHYSQKKYNRKLEKDIEERTRELRKSEEKYRNLINTTLDAIISFDINLRILTWNQGSENLFGWKAEEVTGKKVINFLKFEGTRDEKAGIFGNIFTNGYWKGEASTRNRSGKKLTLLITVNLVKDSNADDLGFVAVIRDITEKKAWEKELASSVFETVEKERDRISRDLHDDLGQILSSAKLKLEAFEYKAGVKNENFNSALTMIDSAGRELRNIIHDLRPVEIERYGLIPSIERLCDMYNKFSDIEFNFSHDNYRGSLSKKDELLIYRIVQEALNNSIKHSGASKVSVIITENNSLFVNIIDDGKGFDINEKGVASGKKSGFGLMNMYQRAELLNGFLRIKTSPGNGVDILLKIKPDDTNEKN